MGGKERVMTNILTQNTGNYNLTHRYFISEENPIGK